ncbi:MAG: reverse transcriptase domain-containing protein [archaeon]
MGNLTIAWRKARENKTKKPDVIEFEKNLTRNLLELHKELKNKIYKPRPLEDFIRRDPKTRKISKADFRDRVIHHALINVIGPEFEKSFFYDSCANQIGKGTSFALRRFELHRKGVTNNYKIGGFCLKADIKHYFQEVNHEVLLKIIKTKIKEDNIIWLIKQILSNNSEGRTWSRVKIPQGMPLGNYTSQFFASIYLGRLDHFVKHSLKAKHYIRYVDDFIILHKSRKQLGSWKEEIKNFLRKELELELHPQKSRIIPLSRGIDFVGFRNFLHYKLLRKRNIKGMMHKIKLYEKGKIDFGDLFESYKGWQAYVRWANTNHLREKIKKEIVDEFWKKAKSLS